jgi:hypothetical protein
MGLEKLPPFLATHYEVYEWKHALAILMHDFPNEWRDIVEVLSHFRLKRSAIQVGGKNKSDVSKQIDTEFYKRGWSEKQFSTAIVVDDNTTESPTHKVDCFKNRIALEVEWNNKDPFYDRDLNNFRLLFDLRVVSVGVIVTRTDELQAIFDGLGRGKSFGNSTTHMSKLIPRINGGGGGGCPILVFGITRKLYLEDR